MTPEEKQVIIDKESRLLKKNKDNNIRQACIIMMVCMGVLLAILGIFGVLVNTIYAIVS